MEMVIDINGLEGVIDIINDGRIPDLKRWYLAERALVEQDPIHHEILKGLLNGYDRGLIDMHIDPWERCVKYFACEAN
tara:strand:- start:201 stop:434 length:234 start_codon:yes stop_codon:yes gene_type:complete